jgi:hypothetical protein
MDERFSPAGEEQECNNMAGIRDTHKKRRSIFFIMNDYLLEIMLIKNTILNTKNPSPSK